MLKGYNNIYSLNCSGAFYNLPAEQETHELLSSIFENMAEAVLILDLDERIVYTNKSIEALSGYPVDKLLGKPVDDYFFTRETYTSFGSWNGMTQVDTPMVFEKFQVKKDGTKWWASVKTSPLKNKDGKILGRVVMINDITKRKRAQKALIKSEEKYRSIIENMKLGIVEVDNHDRITKAYKRFAVMTGYDPEELLGQEYMSVFLSKEYKEIMLEQNARRKLGKSSVYEVQLKKKNGEILWVIISGAPLYDEDNKVTGSIGIHLDITDRKMIEHKLVKAREKAEESSKAKERFLANMSHEIRTPMNAIIGMSHLLNETTLDDKQTKYLSVIHASTNNLMVIINDILDFSKIESGKLTLENTGFRIRKLIRDIKESLGYKAGEKGIQLVSHIDEDIDPVLLGDTVRLNQVLLNLTNNSIKFTDVGVVMVECYLNNKDLKWNEIEFRITDTGIGIEKDKLTRIFESFTQEDDSITRKYGGTGLGLAISRQIVELMGGELLVESEKGKGTAFSFVIKFAVGDESDLDVREKTETNNAMPDNVRVLLVEDNKVNRQMAISCLEHWKLSVGVAENGQEAVDELRSNEYDIVLMDMQMPVMCGLEATRIIRKELGKNVPIIALTANATNGDSLKCIDAGMDDYISKPFEPSDLYNKIVSLVCPEIGNPLLKAHPVEDREQEDVNSNESPCDLTKLSNMYKGDRERIENMIRIILEETPGRIEKINYLLQNKHYSKLGNVAHSMKPTIDILNIKGLSKKIRLVEEYANEKKNTEQLPYLVNNLTQTCNKVFEQLQNEIN
ncbi:MAG: PAS domain S-box protein [Bacteroidota bacterium]